jgi:histidine decarboxylase
MFAKLYKVPPEMMIGFVTTGGTEGNFTGLWWQRDYLKHRSGGYRPILLTSDQSHYSVSKAAQQLDFDGRLVKTNRFGELDCDNLAFLLDELAAREPQRPVLMQVNFGTTQTGALDDLPSINRLLVEKVESRGGLFSIHVDAALMGAVVPITQPFGEVNLFQEFRVSTMAISGHKFFGSVCICGVCLTTQPFLDACFATKQTEVKYLTGIRDMTPSGSRSGFNVLSFHNTLCGLYMHTDANRLQQIVFQCYRNVDYFIGGLATLIGHENIIHAENSLTICFTPPPSDETKERYSLMPVNIPGSPEMAGVCVLVNVTRAQIDCFLKDYARDLRNQAEQAQTLNGASPGKFNRTCTGKPRAV